MRRHLLASVVLVAAVVALPAEGALRAPSKTMTIRLVSTSTQFKFLKDLAPKGAINEGDVVRDKSTLRNEVPQFGKPKGAIVGSDVTIYTAVSKTDGDNKVNTKLPGGTLRAAGRTGRERVLKIPVVGGTGVFAGARGVLEVTSLGGDEARNVYRLVLEAEATTSTYYWTESYTEKILMKNLRIPCKYVRQTRQDPKACDVAAAQERVDSWNASVEACNAKPPEQAYQCLQFLATTGHVVQTLENVKNGFALKSADCIGSGTGIRFSLLRCMITVLDRDVSTNQPRYVSGRIAVTPTGKATFRWSLI